MSGQLCCMTTVIVGKMTWYSLYPRAIQKLVAERLSLTVTESKSNSWDADIHLTPSLPVPQNVFLVATSGQEKGCWFSCHAKYFQA